MKCEKIKYNTQTVLMVLWSVLIFLYLYCDIFSFFKVGTVSDILVGKIGSLEVNQTSLLIASLIMMIPILMILVNLFIKSKTAKWINIIVGIMFVFVNIGNLVGEGWLYYWVYGIIELLVTIFIIIITIKWNN